MSAVASAEKVIAKLREDVNQIQNIPNFDQIVKDIRELPNSSVSRVIKGVFELGSVVITCDLMVSWKFHGYPTPFKIYFPFTYPDEPPAFVLKIPDPNTQCVKKDHKHVQENGLVFLSQLNPWSSSTKMSNLLGEMKAYFEDDYPIRQDNKSKRVQPYVPYRPEPVKIKKPVKKLSVEEAFSDYDIEEVEEDAEYKLENKQTGQKFVGKVIYIKSQGSDDAVARKEVLESYLNFNNPNIVKCFEAIQLDEDKMGLVLEYCDGDSLDKTIADVKKKKSIFSNDSIYNVIVQYGRGLKGLHDLNYVHRGIKPVNLLSTKKNEFKISDLSASIRLQKPSEEMGSMIGTDEYAVPEILKGQKYTFRVDIFSFGVVLYEMIMLTNPFTVVSKDGKSRISTPKQIQGDINPLVSPAHNPALLELVRRMLSLDPVKRPTMGEILGLDFILDFIKRANL